MAGHICSLNESKANIHEHWMKERLSKLDDPLSRAFFQKAFETLPQVVQCERHPEGRTGKTDLFLSALIDDERETSVGLSLKSCKGAGSSNQIFRGWGSDILFGEAPNSPVGSALRRYLGALDALDPCVVAAHSQFLTTGCWPAYEHLSARALDHQTLFKPLCLHLTSHFRKILDLAFKGPSEASCLPEWLLVSFIGAEPSIPQAQGKQIPGNLRAHSPRGCLPEDLHAFIRIDALIDLIEAEVLQQKYVLPTKMGNAAGLCFRAGSMISIKRKGGDSGAPTSCQLQVSLLAPRLRAILLSKHCSLAAKDFLLLREAPSPESLLLRQTGALDAVENGDEPEFFGPGAPVDSAQGSEPRASLFSFGALTSREALDIHSDVDDVNRGSFSAAPPRSVAHA